MRLLFFTILTLIGFAVSAQRFDRTEILKKQDGFFPYYYDQSSDQLFIEVDELNKDFLYVFSLSSGIGSNDIGLDRGQLGNEQVVRFERAGFKLLLVQPNLTYRADTDNEAEKKSIEQAFAKSVLWGFPIVEESNGVLLIELTDFLLRDAHGVSDRLKRSGQGDYRTDLSRSALSMERTKGFPENSEFDVLLTFSGKPKGSEIRSVTPNAELVTVNQHHSFVKLPDDAYQPRRFDPRSGYFPMVYYDYATPVQEPTIQRFIYRHRLEKKDPFADMSEAVEPIIYYLDPGTPEPVRSALLDGGKWWNQAFEAIGYKDAFQVKMLPEDADPLDVRYNVIQWVHRSTRGWSYGSSVSDPRTGEIIKGHVSLGSLRIRQDFLIAQGLMNKPFEERDDNYETMLAMALARIRQLSAHEIGHTLGLSHNFAASFNNRASVMDYPHPLIQMGTDGELDFSEAYDTGIGEWDKVTIAYGYSDFPDDINEQVALNEILSKAQAEGLKYITDQDARPQGGAHPYAHLWDNGTSPADELSRVLQVRKKAIDSFSEYNVKKGSSHSDLEDAFVPVYFFHRYQTEAAVKLIGGLEYSYQLRGIPAQELKMVEASLQRSGLGAVLQTLAPEALTIPERLLKLFPPRSPGFWRSRESFKSRNGVGFDPISAASTASDLTLGLLLHPQRASRLIQQKAMDSKQPGLDEVIDQLVSKTIKGTEAKGLTFETQQVINYNVLKHLVSLRNRKDVHPQVNAIVAAKLAEIRSYFSGRKKSGLAKVYNDYYIDLLNNPGQFDKVEVPQIPDGSPIGMDCMSGK